MSDVPKEKLEKLRRWVMLRRRVFIRIYDASVGTSKERAFGEANVCDSVLTKIDEILKSA